MFFWDASLDFCSALCLYPCLIDTGEEVLHLLEINKWVFSWFLGMLPLLIVFFLLAHAICLPGLLFLGMPRG